MDRVDTTRVELEFWMGWDESADDVPGVVRQGRIVGPDGLDDRFFAPLSPWDSSDYETQWREGVGRIVNGEDSSALITRLNRSANGTSYFGERWCMWREGDIAVLRNQLILTETLPDFDPVYPYRSVPRRRKKKRVSEWQIPISALKRFLALAQ